MCIRDSLYHWRSAAGAGAAGSCAGTAVRRGPPVHWDGGCHCGTGVWLYAGDSASEMDPAVNEQYYLLVAAKLRETAAHVIAMSVLVLNLRKIQRALLRMLAYLLEILAQNKNWALVQWTLVRPLETGVVGHKSYILLFSYSSIFRVQMKFYCF